MRFGTPQGFPDRTEAPETRLGATSHGIVLDEEAGELNLILVCGDVVMPYVLSPDDLTDDPVAAAQMLWPKMDQAPDDPDHRRITYKT